MKPLRGLARRRPLELADLSGYIYNSQLPEYFDRRRMTFTRGGLADLLHEFNRLHTRRYRFESRLSGVFGWRESCDRDFRRRRPASLYENIPSDFPDIDRRFVDLRPYLENPSPFTGLAWADSFRPEALKATGLHSSTHRPIFSLAIDFSCPAINFNVDVLLALGVRLPIRTWAEFAHSLETCAEADFVWPIALFNAPPTEGLHYFARGIQSMVMRSLLDTLDSKRDGRLDEEEWREAIGRKRFHERLAPVRESLDLLKKLSRYFVWYANRYDSIHVKPFFFSRRPQCLFRVGDFRRVRADMELHGTVQNGRRLFPFREGAMQLPVITRETSPLASGPAAEPFFPSMWLSVTRSGKSREEIETCIRFLQFFTTPENQRFFTRWSNTLSAVRDVPLPEILKDVRIQFEVNDVVYMGLSPKGRAIWSEAARNFIEPEGDLKTMLSETRRALDADRKFYRETRD